MDFITLKELADFHAVQGTTYHTKDKEIYIDQLTKGVFAKVDYWRWLINAEGFETHFRYSWQNSGNFRKYAWARIYLPGHRSSHIYFNIGISATTSTGEIVEPYFFYKLDCQRTNGLSTEQVQAFDHYLNTNYPKQDAQWQSMSQEEALQLDWDTLANRVLQFIDKHRHDYLYLVDLLWPPHIARICWNDFAWKRPSGSIGKSKTTEKSQEKEKGFGFEEWLFDLDTQINGYHYGFLQAFNKGQHEGKVYDVKLYAIYRDDTTKTHQYFWVGRIHQLEVLTETQRQEALDIYHRNGTYERMESELKIVGIQGFDFEHVDKEKMLNIRFKVNEEAFSLFESPLLIADPTVEIGKNRHYVLLPTPKGSNPDQTVSGKYKFKGGHNTTKTGTTTVTSPASEITRSLLHKDIQEKIFEQLEEKYKGTPYRVGTEESTGYGTSIDLVVHHPEEGDIFYEVKTGHSAINCIREALGQLLEYAMYPDRQLAKQLIIVSPHDANPQVRSYLRHLRKILSLEIYYQQFDKDTMTLLEEVY